MDTSNIIDRFGFGRLVYTTGRQNISKEELAVIEQVKEFGIDSIYFCNDGQHSYPVLFLKEVNDFSHTILNIIAEIHKKAWNYMKVLFFYVYTNTEIRIYNCIEKPIIITQQTDYAGELKKIEIINATISDIEKLNSIIDLFSAISIDTGIIWTLDKAITIREKIHIQTRVDNYLVNSLIIATKKLEKSGLSVDLIHKLMLRSLFL
jgi:hypothetical protein